MPTDFTVVLQDQPGELARLGEVAGAAGVNFRGLAGFTGEGRGFIHVLVEDGDVARTQEAFGRAGIGIADTREVVLVEVEDRPGGLGDVLRRLAEANVNVELAYTAIGGVRVAIVTDDVRNARDALI